MRKARVEARSRCVVTARVLAERIDAHRSTLPASSLVSRFSVVRRHAEPSRVALILNIVAIARFINLATATPTITRANGHGGPSW